MTYLQRKDVVGRYREYPVLRGEMLVGLKIRALTCKKL